MPRASWRGFLRLSLVSCPVYLSPATTRTKPIRWWTPEGRHYSGVGGAGALAVILGSGWAGRSSFSLFSKRLSSGSGSV